MTDAKAASLGRRVGQGLLGTCNYPERYIEEQDLDPGLTLNMAFCEALDATAMCCDNCDWYVEPSELDDENRCGDCQPENEQDA